LLVLGAIAVLMVATAYKLSNPRAWQWVRGPGDPPPGIVASDEEKILPPPPPQLGFADRLRVQQSAGQAAGVLAAFASPTLAPASIDAAFAGPLHLEHVPLPDQVEPPAHRETRRAPIPDPTILAGAYDRQRFLLDDPLRSEEAPENILNEQRRRDADARYHLLQLAHFTAAENLAADARSDVRHTALIEKPADFRGEVIHVEGELVWVQHFELKRPIAGLEHAYSGALLTRNANERYFLLFTELPPNFPPQKDWPRLYRSGVRFNGYFLKVLLDDHPREKGKFVLHPVLVGKTIDWPSSAEESGWSFPIGPTLGVIGAVIVLVLVVGYFYRKSDQSHAERLAAVRHRVRAAANKSQTAEDSEPFEPPLRSEPERTQRNGASRSPPESRHSDSDDTPIADDDATS
jgi:hypothetical protein